MDLAKVLDALRLAGTATPAFKALFEQALQTFAPADQAELKSAYEKARAASDDAQDDFTAAGRGD